MALLTQMEQAHTQRYLLHVFTHYYQNARLELPPRFNHREWGFIPWGEGGMRRHLHFHHALGLSAYLERSAPAHAYHSAAYYRDPAAAKMVDKKWQGADLIFDLDADHMENPPGTPFPELMSSTLVETRKLVHEFLLGDLGLDPRWMKVYFSGGRGYHIHVRDPQLLGLDSRARREIVDYIIGQGLEVDRLLLPRVRALSRYKGHLKTQVLQELPPPEADGWAGRLTRALMFLTRELLPAELRTVHPTSTQPRPVVLLPTEPLAAPPTPIYQPPDQPPCERPTEGPSPARVNGSALDNGSAPDDKEVQGSSPEGSQVALTNRRRRFLMDRLLQIKGVGPKTASSMAELLLEGANYQTLWQTAPAALKKHWLEAAVETARGHTDEPVTTDLHRLIRLPGSLHGGTGLAVVPVDLDDMTSFDPYEQAVAFDDSPVRLRVGLHPGKVTLKGEPFDLSPGEVVEVPQYAAVYFLCRKWATLVLSRKEVSR